jgi:5'-3' exonuclease
VLVCTPDKDLAQCVVGTTVVQVDRRTGEVRDERGVWDKFGVAPSSIADWLALVGDSADGFPGVSGWGKRSASVVLARYGTIDAVPPDPESWDPAVLRLLRGAPRLASRLREDRELVELFRRLATLRVDRSLLDAVESLRWRGPTPAFERVCGELDDPDLAGRVEQLRASRADSGA